MSILPPGTPADDGADVTAALGVRKWEPPAPAGLAGRVKGPFPGFLSKTDETRVQVLEAVPARHRGRSFVVTEKLDDTSFTAFRRAGEFGVCSRNLWLDETDETNGFVRLARVLTLDDRLRALRDRLGADVAVQAEVIGPGVQKNKYALKEVMLRVFSVLDLDASRLVDHAAVLGALAAVGLSPVPQLGALALDHTVDQLVASRRGRVC